MAREYRHRYRPRLCTITTLLLVATPHAIGQCEIFESQKFRGDTTDEQTQFGKSMHVHDDRAVIGANGTAYVFELDSNGTWTQMQELVPEELFGGYGKSVAIHGDVALVGCLFAGDNGGAFVFRFDGQEWVQEDVLTPTGGDGNDDFGFAVAIDTNVAVIGGPQYYNTGDPGQAVVFEYDGLAWLQRQTLRASDDEPNDEFGNAVALDRDVILVGAYNEGHTSRSFRDGTGAAYVFRRDRSTGEWMEEAKLVSADPVPGELDQFGFAVDVDGEELLIGTNPIAFSESPHGSAYVFRFDGETWNVETKLLAPDGQGGDRFGSAVALNAGLALCGAWAEWSIGTHCPFPEICESGSAYLFTRSGTNWTVTHKFFPADIERDDRFAWSVALSDQAALAGAWGDEDAGTLSGAAYSFDVLDCAPVDLDVEATCPTGGLVTLRWRNAAPRGRVAFVMSSDLGEFTIPSGKPCAGVTLDLVPAGLRVALVKRSDATGAGVFQASAPQNACGKFLQLIDLENCELSAPERIL